MKKTKREKVADLLSEAGFEPDSFGFTVTKGPKSERDALAQMESHVAQHDGI